MDATSDQVWTFVGVIEPMAWGRSTYTVVRIPPGLVEAAGAAGTRRIAGTIDGTPVNLAITRAPVIEDAFVWAGRSLLRRLGVQGGAAVECRFRPVDPDEVEMPADVDERLELAGLRARWELLPAATRRRHLSGIDAAVNERTRARPLDELVDLLTGKTS